MKTKILLVEPDPICRWYLIATLANDYEVIGGVSGMEAVKQQIAAEFPDLLVVGERQPHGLWIAKWARINFAIPTILLTTERQIDLQQYQLFYHGIEVVQKPFQWRQIRRCINKTLGKRHGLFLQ